MAAKLILCAFLAVCAFQAGSSIPFGTNLFLDTIQEALVKAKEAIYNITVRLEAIGQQATSKIPAIIAQIKDTSARLIEGAEGKVQGLKTSIDNKSQELLRIAAERGVDASYCVASQKMNVDELIQSVREFLERCDTNTLGKPKKIVEAIEQVVRKGDELGRDSQVHNEYCLTFHDPTEVVNCLADNTKTLKLEAIRLEVQIGENLVLAEKLVKETQDEVPICIALNLINTEPRSGAILKEFVLCVMDKINGQ